MNDYRVDRAREGLSPPCGMNSIVYVGESLNDALRVFHATTGGKDGWGNSHGDYADYGVMLSMWHPERNAYITKRWKSK